MTPEEFKAKMREIYDGKHADLLGKRFDEEQTHELADELMVELLRSLGYGEGVDIFWNMHKWYA